jgi:hypothetical protein
MSLSMGERIHRREWISLPMSEDIIDSVHKLATTSPTEIVFGDKYGNIIEDESDSDSNTELDGLGTTVIIRYENNHSKDTVEEGNQLSHNDESVHANQASTPTELEHTNMPDDDHGDQSAKDKSIPVEITGGEPAHSFVVLLR